MEGYNQNVTEVTGECGDESLLILMNAFIRQQEEYLVESARVVDELDREMRFLISENLVRQQEYLNSSNSSSDSSALDQRKEMIEKHLRTKTHNVDKGEDDDSDVCSICLDGFVEGSSVGILDCSHEFHSDCVTNWLVINNVCPLCKSSGVRYG